MFNRCLAIALLAMLSVCTFAQEEERDLELRRIQMMLATINLELRSDLDQVLLLQEAIKVNGQAPLEALGRSPDAVSFEDVAAAKRRALEREAAINARLDAILLRSAALDAKKQPLLDRIRELGERPEATTAKLGKAPM
jgi:hypothetical protein